MSKFYVNYNTGAGNEWVEGTLEEAMETAESGLAYTQTSVTIKDENGKDIAKLPWCGVSSEYADEDEIITADFGDFGYYGGWIELD